MVDCDRESFDLPYAEIFPGLWSICTKHAAGLIDLMPKINNRAFVVRIKDSEGNFLLVFGVPDAVPQVKQLEEETGLKVRFVVGSGAAHHMMLESWFEGFPDAEILLTGNKIPQTRNGMELKQKYGERWTEYMGSSFPPLERYKEQVDFVIFTEFYGYKDKEFMSKSKTEQSKASFFGFASRMAFTPMDQPVDGVWFYFPAAKLLCLEHNFHIYFTEEQLANMPFAFRMLFPARAFGSALKDIGSKVRNWDVHTQQCRYVLDNMAFDTVTCLHREPGNDNLTKFRDPEEGRARLKEEFDREREQLTRSSSKVWLIVVATAAAVAVADYFFFRYVLN